MTDRRILIPKTLFVGMNNRYTAFASMYRPAAITGGGTDSASRSRMATISHRFPICYTFDNRPLSGFVLGGSAGKSDMSVHDPRGFSITMSVGSVMETIKSCTVVNGVISQPLVYARENGQNILLDTSSELYQTSLLQTELAASKLPWKQAKIGNRVSLTNGRSGVWLGQQYLLTVDQSAGYHRQQDSVNKIQMDTTKKHVLLTTSVRSGTPELYFSHTARLARVDDSQTLSHQEAEDCGNNVLRQYAHNLSWNTKVIGLSLAEFDLNLIRLAMVPPSKPSSKVFSDPSRANVLGVQRNGRIMVIDEKAWEQNQLVFEGNWHATERYRWISKTVDLTTAHNACAIQISTVTKNGAKIEYDYHG